MFTGLQLYNFRSLLKQDFKGVMREIAKLGFDAVEFAGVYNVPADELAAFLKELNLRCAGTMFPFDKLLDPASEVYEYAQKLNSPAVTISAQVDFSKEWRMICDRCIGIGKVAATKPGLVFSYHNHWAEFALADGVPAMERILAATDPKQVFIEPDVCWLTRAGVDIASYLKRNAARIRQVHLKDIVVPTDPDTTAILGEGIVDLEAAVAAAKQTDAQFLIYEQDECPDPFVCAEKSLAWMKKHL